MARDLLPGKGLLATPNQASSLFNPDGPHPIRQKHLFAVRFMRAGVADASSGLTFVVKQIDRPQVSPQVEEINQYNKKRLVHTGVKYNPVSCTLYDTADGAAMNMWLDYARYYFGDYSQPATPGGSNGYSDDILNSALLDPSDDQRGWGFNIRPTSSFDIEGTGSQYFFDRVRVYQLWGNEYTSYDLLNPRINSFTPDDLDYSSSEANTIQVSLSYEAISHTQNGLPGDVFTEESLLLHLVILRFSSLPPARCLMPEAHVIFFTALAVAALMGVVAIIRMSAGNRSIRPDTRLWDE